MSRREVFQVAFTPINPQTFHQSLQQSLRHLQPKHTTAMKSNPETMIERHAKTQPVAVGEYADSQKILADDLLSHPNGATTLICRAASEGIHCKKHFVHNFDLEVQNIIQQLLASLAHMNRNDHHSAMLPAFRNCQASNGQPQPCQKYCLPFSGIFFAVSEEC